MHSNQPSLELCVHWKEIWAKFEKYKQSEMDLFGFRPMYFPYVISGS